MLLFCTLFPALAISQTSVSIQSKTKSMKAYKGFQDFYWDETTGKIWLEIKRFDQELLYQTSLPAGVGSNDIGLDRGKLGHSFVVSFKRVGNKVLLIESNYAYRALTNDVNERRAVEQSFARSVIWGFTIEAVSGNTVLVDATGFLFRDALQIPSQLLRAQQGEYKLNESRSAIYPERTKNFPLNTEFETTITYVNKDGKTGSYVREVTPSPEAITVRVHHSLVQLPDSNFKPRLYDARSPYISNSYFDYSTPVSEPINKRFIIRHRLEKKDPSAARSEAIKPIIYYLDNGTPEPIRSALLEGARWWNQAFEAAGFINAFQVKILPDDADPMDLRYNMVNWVHRSTRGWSYGYAVVDPRTGEILKGNVTLGSLRVRQDYMIAQGLLSPFAGDSIAGENQLLKMSLQRLKQLSAHEIGHTLGILHNYIASAEGRASVMDYPPPVVQFSANGDLDLSRAYTNEIGDWDKVSIRYGYTQFAAGTDESVALDQILREAQSKGLTFISDRDARDPAGLHPAAHLWDNGADAIAELRHVMKVRANALSRFGINSIRKGDVMATLEDVLVPVYLFHRYQVEAASKLVGGMDYSYALKGDGQMVTRPVVKDRQLAALNALLDCMDPAALEIPEGLVKLIPPRPAEYEYTRELFPRKTGLAFDPLAAAETAADLPLSFLFVPARLNRMAESEHQDSGLSITGMVNYITARLFPDNPLTGFKRLIQLQNQQLFLTYLLSASVQENSSFATKAALVSLIDKLKTSFTQKLATTTDEQLRGYLLLSLERMKSPDKARPTQHAVAPPGAPIGCGFE